MSTLGNLVRLARDVMLVSLGKYGQYVVTLVTVPLCARLLGVEGTGLLAVATAAYFFGSIFVDWGLTQILAARTGRGTPANSIRAAYAKLRGISFTLITLGLAIALLSSAPPLLVMVALGLFAGGVSSLGEEWILIGRGQFARIAGIQMTGRIVYLVSLVLLLPMVRQPWLPMTLLAAGNLVSATLSWIAVRATDFDGSRDTSVRTLLRDGRSPAVARLLAAGYGQGSSVYFSLVVAIPALGLFSAADKLTRAAGSALDAFGLALLPRMSKSMSVQERFWASARKATWAAFCLGLLVAACLFLAAPLVIWVLYGDGFGEAIGLLQVLVWLLPASATSSMLSTSVLYVVEDSKGILGGAVLGTGLGGVALLMTGLSGGDVVVMVISVAAVEWLVMSFIILRVRYLRINGRMATMSTREPAST